MLGSLHSEGEHKSESLAGQVVLHVSCDVELPSSPMAGAKLQRVFVVLKLLEEVIR